MKKYTPKVGDYCQWLPTGRTKASWKTCRVEFIHGKNFCLTNFKSFKTKQVVSNVMFRPIPIDLAEV